MDSAADVRAYLNGLHQAVWELAAVAVALDAGAATDPSGRRPALDVLVEAGLIVEGPRGTELSAGLRAAIGDVVAGAGADAVADAVADVVADRTAAVAADAASEILQVAALVSDGTTWTAQDDRALLARGRASAQVAEPFKTFVLPMMDGLEAMLADGVPAMLDVGVGVAGLAVAFCRAFPGLRIVGIDVFPRALELARHTVDDAGLGDRIELRVQDVADLEDRDAFCLAWVPAPFIPRPALDEGVPLIARALVPEGWIALGHGKVGQSGLQNALSRLRAEAFGGAAIHDDEAQEMLRGAGFERVATLPTPPGAPGLTVGRRPRSSPGSI